MIKNTDTAAAAASATEIAYQTPSSPHISGRIRIVMIWNNNVLKNEISADTAPLFRAVKKEEPKIPNPLNKNETENNRNALVVSSVSAGSYPTKILAKGEALKTAIVLKTTPAPSTSIMLLRNIFFSSSSFPAP